MKKLTKEQVEVMNFVQSHGAGRPLNPVTIQARTLMIGESLLVEASDRKGYKTPPSSSMGGDYVKLTVRTLASRDGWVITRTA